MSISSTGQTAETWPSVLGVYKITNITHSGRPVWQSTVRKDRYLIYNGNTFMYLIIDNFLSPYKGIMENGLYTELLTILVLIFGLRKKV